MISEYEAYILLSAGILEQAIADYKDVLQGRKVINQNGKIEATIPELEKFFLSQYGQTLSRGNGERIIARCRREAKETQGKKTKAHGKGLHAKPLDYSGGVVCTETGDYFKTPHAAAEWLGCKTNGIFISCRYGKSICGKHFIVVKKG